MKLHTINGQKDAINILKTRDILKALENKVDIDYCGLTEYEIVDLIKNELKNKE